jgi:bacterioferritin-associated ferredoxin
MVICQCNVIGCGEIRAAVGEIKAAEPYALVTPAGVFRCCGKRPICGGCMPLVTAIIQDALAAG